MEIVDAHHHLWDIERNFYPWMNAVEHDRGWGDWSSLKRTYGVKNFLEDAAEAGVRLLKSVHIQANYDPSNPVGETRWLEEVASEPKSEGLPSAIVGYADLSEPNVMGVLESHSKYPRMRGIRQVLNRHPDPRLNRAPRNYLSDDRWREGFAQLERFGLSFDAQIYHHQAQELAELAQAYPSTQIILDHAGMPLKQDSEGHEAWRRAIANLARQPNVCVKIGGFGMVDNHWTTDSIRPFVRHCIECFGPERTMFSSNFPVDRLMATYERIWSAYAEIVSDFGEREQHLLFRGSAERIYRI